MVDRRLHESKEYANEYLGSTTDYGLFIDGKYRESSNNERTEIIFPYNNKQWATVPNGNRNDIDEAVSVASRTFDSAEWGDLGARGRREILEDIADIFESNAEELAAIETIQNGKVLHELVPQMDALAEYYRYFARMCDEMESGRTNPVDYKDGEMFNYVKKEPYGVVGAITPWNQPLLVTSWKLAPALAAGNTFVLKPSEETPVSALRLAELIYEETEMPNGVYNVVPGRGREAGAVLSKHPDINKITFTGSTEVGREVAKNASENLATVSMELGGKNPNIIFSTANLDNAINGVIKGLFAATGQMCMAGSRILVHESVRNEFIDRFTERTADITLGDPLSQDTDIGPVAFRDQWEKVAKYIDIGANEGATLAFGGEQPDDLPGDCFLQPTILTDVDPGMRVAQEEIFGPVASVIEFEDEKEALKIANDVEYGLVAGVWTEDMAQAFRMVNKIEAGGVWVNEYRIASQYSPFGGYKDSGFGRENGLEGLAEYYQSKSVWFDYSEETGDPFSPYADH